MSGHSIGEIHLYLTVQIRVRRFNSKLGFHGMVEHTEERRDKPKGQDWSWRYGGTCSIGSPPSFVGRKRYHRPKKKPENNWGWPLCL